MHLKNGGTQKQHCRPIAGKIVITILVSSSKKMAEGEKLVQFFLATSNRCQKVWFVYSFIIKQIYPATILYLS